MYIIFLALLFETGCHDIYIRVNYHTFANIEQFLDIMPET